VEEAEANVALARPFKFRTIVTLDSASISSKTCSATCDSQSQPTGAHECAVESTRGAAVAAGTRALARQLYQEVGLAESRCRYWKVKFLPIVHFVAE
jgi:hypothetical protein